MIRRLAREDGIAMPVAMSVLVMCLTLTALVASSTDVLSRTSGEDQRSKRALAAADAGVAVAVRRLRNLPYLDNTHCLTTQGVAPGTAPAAAGECPAHTESLGANASFTYHVTPVLTAPAACYEVPGQTIPSHFLRRCITATGTIDGVTRRVQRQVVAPPLGVKQWVGVLGLDSVTIRNSAHLSTCNANDLPWPKVAANVSIVLDNSSYLNWGSCPSKPSWGLEIGPTGTATVHQGSQPAGLVPTRASQPFTIPPPPRDWEDVENTNSNALVAGYAKTSTTWNALASQRSLVIGSGGTTTFTQGGDYSFCHLSLATDATLEVPANQRTRIFIDAPTRPGSSCASSSAVVFGTRTRVNWPATVNDTDFPTLTVRGGNVELYSYSADVTVGNSARFAGLIQAERSTAHFANGSMTFGAAAARHVVIDNSGDFNRPDRLWGRDGFGPEYKSAGWAQCKSLAPVATDPESGCV